MNKNAIIFSLLMTASVTSFAQETEKKTTPARPAEKKEVDESRHLRKTLEKKQLNTIPLNVFDTTETGTKAKQAKKNRNRKQCKKKGA